MKTCVRCGKQKPLDEFYEGRPGQLVSRCKLCHGMIESKCRQCGTVFVAKRGRVLCSDGCRKKNRPPTFKTCERCGCRFGPVNRLTRRFCSLACSRAAKRTGRRVIRRTITKARSAQSLLRYHVQAGNIVRSTVCEECGLAGRRIEAAHFNYDEPLRVRWLCVSCHRRWDKREPKNATVIVPAR